MTEAQVGVSVTVQGQTRLAHALSLELFDSLQIGIRSDGRPSKKTAAKITFFQVNKSKKSIQKCTGLGPLAGFWPPLWPWEVGQLKLV